MKKLFYLSILLISINFSAVGQKFPSQLWHDGELVLRSGDTLKGKINYDLENDLIQLNYQNKIKTFSARKILHFEIYDETASRYREFYAIPYQVRPNYKVPRLFEVLYEDAMTLLCRESVVQENVPHFGYNYYGNFYSSRYRLVYTYYFLSRDGEIEEYTSKKKELYEILDKNQPALKDFIKEHNLRYDRQSDLIKITAFYNDLVNNNN